MNSLITDELLDEIHIWPRGFAKVEYELGPGGQPHVAAHICLRNPPSASDSREAAAVFHVGIFLIPDEHRYFLSLYSDRSGRKHRGLIHASVKFLDDRSGSISCDLGIAARDSGNRYAIVRFLHPLVMHMHREGSRLDQGDEITLFFSEASVTSINNLSGYRFGLMVHELRQLLQH